MDQFAHAQTVMIILFGALATYLTRLGGYVLITRMKRIPPRVEAGLNAVPAAVLTTLVAPAAVTGGLDVTIAILVAFLAGLRLSILPVLFAGWATVMILRHLVA